MTHAATTTGDGLLQARSPKPTLAIGKEKVLVAIGLLGVLLAVAIGFGNTKSSSQTKNSSDLTRKTGLPAYNIVSLPSTYQELPPPPSPSPSPKHPELQHAPATRASEREGRENKLLEDRLQRAQAAKLAPVAFQNIQVPQPNPLSVAGATPSDSMGGSSSPTEQPLRGASPRDDDNRQDDKNEFLSSRRLSPVALSQRLTAPRSPFQLMAGTLIPGVLLTALNSDLPGQILGQVSQNVFDTVSGNHLLIPQGTKVIGEYDSRIVYGQERLLIVWTRLILPNGKSISLESMPGVDLSGSSGLTDQVNHHWRRLVTSVVFSSLLGASAQIAQGRTYNSFDPSYGQLATQGVAQNMNEVGQQITRKNLNIQPTIEIRAGFRFNVFVHKDMALEPYDSNPKR